MKTSDQGIMSIIRHEGVVLSRYKDAVNVWTIGVGHTANAGHPDPERVTWKLSMDEVFDILRRDLAKFEDRVNRAVKVPMSQHEFDALVSFDFNTGGIYRATLTKRLNAGNRKGAAAAFMNWTNAGGRKLPALVKRRAEERAIFERGAYPDPIANIYPATSTGRVQWSKAKRIDLRTVLTKAKPLAPPKPEPPEPKPLPKPVPPQPKKPKGAFAALVQFILKLFGKEQS